MRLNRPPFFFLGLVSDAPRSPALMLRAAGSALDPSSSMPSPPPLRLLLLPNMRPKDQPFFALRAGVTGADWEPNGRAGLTGSDWGSETPSDAS
jgi:hypothetical protein